MLIGSSIKKKSTIIFLLAFSLIVSCGHFSRVQAEQALLLDEFDPQATSLGIYNSFQHHLVIIAFTQKNRAPFDCHPNRYVFYDYKQEDYYEVSSGSLKISSDYRKLIQTKIHAVVSMPESNHPNRQLPVQLLLAQMNISALTMEDGKTASSDGTVSCWQQPEVIELATRKSRIFPFLVANLCKYAWCSELYWINNNSVRLWVQINPKELQLINLHTGTGVFKYKDKTPKYFRKEFSQFNAPRDNLVDNQNFQDGSFALNSKAGNYIGIHWKLHGNNRIRVELKREKENNPAGKTIMKRIAALTEEKKYTEALGLFKFGFWLTPDNMELKVEKLRLFASLLLIDNFIRSLEEDFTREERINVCNTLRFDKTLNHLKRQNHFNKRFKESCL